MWTRAALLVVLAAALLVTVVASRPGSYLVTRSTTVSAPPDLVAGRAADLQGWGDWWPALRRHPDRERRFGGPATGAGASCYWADPEGLAGAQGGERGRITLVAAGPTAVVVELEDERPRPRTSDLELQVAGHGGGAVVVLTRSGDLDPWERVQALVSSPEGRLGPELDEALAGLKAQAEAAARVPRHRAERSILVAAAPQEVLAVLSAPDRWRDCSPFGPGAGGAWQVGGPASGPGATAYWSDGTRRGRLTVIAAGPDRLELEAALSAADLTEVERDLAVTVTPAEGGARVAWTVAFEGAEAFPGEADALGVRLEEGLARLRGALRSPGAPATGRVARGP